jgi:ribosomal protein S12 methylthiotransferase accessory factor
MQELFARAASLLLGNEVDAAGDHDAMRILQALEYASESSNRIDPETANHAHLLIAASRFARVFELASPDAPGLFSFGAQFDPALADPLHDGSPMVGVSGVGLTLRDAFQGCIGEGIEYLSQLQAGTDLLLKPGIDDWAGKLGPKTLELVAAVSERRMQPERVLSWCRATRLTDGAEVWLPADICLRRPPAQRDFAPPFPLSIGSAAAPSRDAAALHGLLELIERDAASLWWRGGQLARSIPPQHEAGIVAEGLLRQLRHGASGRRRTGSPASTPPSVRVRQPVPGGKAGPRRRLAALGIGVVTPSCGSPGRFRKNWSTPSSQPNAASAAMTRSTPRIAPTCSARRSMPISADCCSRSRSTRTICPFVQLKRASYLH